MKVLPDTLKARSLLILAVIFILSHGFSLFIYESDRERSILLTEAADLAQRISGIVDLASSFPPDEREGILNAAQTQFIAASPDIAPTDTITCLNNTFAEDVQARINLAFSHHPDYQIDVCVRRFVSLAPLAGLGSENTLDMLVNIQFPDAETASFHAALPRAASLYGDAILIYLVLVTLTALLLAWYLILRLIEPINRLGNAAQRIGRDLDAYPLPEDGPRELRIASKAFNTMQNRLQYLLQGQTEMFSAISHDMKSSITRLQLRAEMLSNDNERQGMERVVGDMRQMVTAIIDYLRGGSSTEPLCQLNMSFLIESIADDFREEGKAVSDHVEPDINLLCQPTELRRAIHNLLENALIYAGAANITLSQTPDQISVCVRDNGPGIPEQHLEDVLRPFFRVEPSRSNTTGGQGLGLAIAQSVIQTHQGSLHLKNLPEGGLLAELKLPRLKKI